MQKKGKDERIRSANPVGLRLSPALKSMVVESANAKGVSVNSEIVMRIQSTFHDEPDKELPIKDQIVKSLDGLDERALKAILEISECLHQA